VRTRQLGRDRPRPPCSDSHGDQDSGIDATADSLAFEPKARLCPRCVASVPPGGLRRVPPAPRHVGVTVKHVLTLHVVRQG
jgi:hypothetical protein